MVAITHNSGIGATEKYSAIAEIFAQQQLTLKVKEE